MIWYIYFTSTSRNAGRGLELSQTLVEEKRHATNAKWKNGWRRWKNGSISENFRPEDELQTRAQTSTLYNDPTASTSLFFMYVWGSTGCYGCDVWVFLTEAFWTSISNIICKNQNTLKILILSGRWSFWIGDCWSFLFLIK